MNKKGLAIIYDPHNLYQFLWYYCGKGQNKEWDALCLPNGYKGEYMHSYCEASKVFSRVYRNDTDFSILPVSKKLRLLIQMCFYFIMGKRKQMCKKIIGKYVKLDDYEELVVIADVGIISGACVALGDEYKVVILEDGIGDYGERPDVIPKSNVFSAYSWQGFLLSKMGYCSPGWFRLKTDKKCIKYASHPDKMKYTGYKELRRLYGEPIDENKFDRILKNVYPEIEKLDFESIDTVIFTRSLSDYVVDYEKYKSKFETYIGDRYRNILLKKHPREKETYFFGADAVVSEVDNSIPAEVLLPYLRNREVYLISESAIIMYFDSYDIKCNIIEFEGMYEESVGANVQFPMTKKGAAKDFCERFLDNQYELIKL